MRRIFFAALVVLLPMSVSARDYCDGNFCYQKKARVSCFRPEIWSVLHKIVARVGRIEITSGCDGKHATRSFHYVGQAVDFRPMQVSQKTILAVLRSMPEVGGIGAYSTGFVHADVGARKAAWFGHRRSRYASAKGRRLVAAAEAAYARAQHTHAHARPARARTRLADVRGPAAGTALAGQR
jgi:hypothetical protein